jgi:hypothetical protein
MTKGLVKKIIMGGMLVGGLAAGIAGLTGCYYQRDREMVGMDISKPANKEKEKVEYFTDKGLIYKFSEGEGANNVAMAVGDMDGDGDNDVLLAKSPGRDRGVKYFENLGNGQYVDRGLIYKFSEGEGANNVAMAVGDMDGDGDNDVLLAKSPGRDRGVRYIENNMPQKNKVKEGEK